MWAVGLTQSVEGHRSKPRGFLRSSAWRLQHKSCLFPARQAALGISDLPAPIVT